MKTLDPKDKDFGKNLATALGIKPGSAIHFITPQFERTDGCVIDYYPKSVAEYELLKLLNTENLKRLGCQVWDMNDACIHWLYPKEWYDCIPEGIEIIYVSGNVNRFKHGETDDDIRFGALAFGFYQVT